MTWHPIETAPKDGTVFLAYWSNEWPVFVSWFDAIPNKVRTTGFWWWRKEITEPGVEAGFRVLCWSPRFERWGINGNCAPFVPSHWQPLPPPPELNERSRDEERRA